MGRPFTPDDLWSLRRVGRPELAQDGSFVVVPVTDYSEEHPSGRTVLYLLTDGAEARQITSSEFDSTEPRVSPDGRALAFARKRSPDEKAQVHVMRLDGGEPARVTDLPLGVADLRWLPDGSGLLFLTSLLREAPAADATARLLEERRDAPVKAHVTEDRTYRFWDTWHTDGKVHHLMRLDLASGDIVDLMPDTATRLDMNRPAGLWDVSPEGSEVAYTAFTHYPLTDEPNRAVYVVPLDGGKPEPITADRPAHQLRPRYSPDGRYLAYGIQEEWDFYADRVRLAVLDRHSGRSETLTEQWDRSASAWEFTPDGSRLVFAAEDRARLSLFTMPPAAGEPDLLLRGGYARSPQPAGDGNTYFSIESLSRPPEVARVRTEGGDVEVLGHFNDSLLAEIQMGEVDEVEVPGADGTPIQAFIVYPPGYSRDTRWPLLHDIHGGPHGVSGDQFHFRWNAQAFAAPGYVVALVNFHGSSSFGQDFATSIHGAWGDKPTTDVLAVTDHLVAKGNIDPGRMAIAGGSYGGYLVAWLAAHTDRFAAAICHAGVVNLLGQYASDVTQGRGRSIGTPWLDVAGVNRWSPTDHTRDMNIPMLVIHGEQDYRVVVTQGLELYGLLKAKGIEARLVYYPDEHHWILKRHNSLHWYGEVLDWLHRHLGTSSDGNWRHPR